MTVDYVSSTSRSGVLLAEHVWIPTVRQGIKSFPYWQQFVVDSFPWLEVDRGSRDFKASVRFRTFGDGSLAAMATAACRVTRNARNVRRAEAGFLKIMWQRSGMMGIEQDGRSCRLSAGMAAICDTGRPYQLTLDDDASLVVLTLPYRAIVGWERLSQRVCGAALQDRAVFGAALAASLSLLDDAVTQANDGARIVLQGVESMLSASLHHGTGRHARGHQPLQMDGVAHHVMKHIDDPNLSPDELASSLGVSRRTLYALFQEQSTTPSRFIRNVRLDAVRRALVDASNARKSILDIAVDHGFPDGASFSRTFKAAYGMSPSEWRSRGATTRLEA